MAKSSQAVSFRMASEKLEKLERLAKATDRSRSWHIEQALDSYLDVHAWQLAHIEKGLASIETDGTVPHEKVRDWLLTWGEEDEAEPPE